MALAYWCMLAAAVLPYLSVAVAKALGDYDNADPRSPDSYRGLALRADSAHKNGLEAFPFFAVAVLVASGGSPHMTIPLLDTLAFVWLGLRIAYLAVYLAGYASVRSVIWVVGFFLTVAIFTMPAWHA